MKNKYFICFGVILFIMVLCTPNTYALTEAERLEKLDVIPFEIIEGEKILKVKAIDPDIVIGESCEYGIDDYNNVIRENPDIAERFTSEEWITSLENECKYDFYYKYLRIYIKTLGLNLNFDNEYSIGFNFENPNKNEAIFSYNDEDGHGNEYNIHISYLDEYSETIFNDSKRVLNLFTDKKFSAYGLSLVNSIYHYKSLNDKIYMKDVILYRYPEVKKIVEENSNYNFVTDLVGEGGKPYESISDGLIGVLKNDVLYNVENIYFRNYFFLFVDEDAEGTIAQKAVNRLKEYFHNTIEVTYDESTMWEYGGPEDDDMNDLVNGFLKTDNLVYTGTYIEFLLDGIHSGLVVIEVPKEQLDVVKIESIDINTGIKVETTSYDVPIDASLNVKDVTNEDYVKEALFTKKLVVNSAYDINLKKMTDGTFVRTIEDGIEVYLPIEGYKENDKVNVYYVKNDKTIGETIEGIVVKVGDQLYVKFITNHFSTYAIGNQIVENEIIDNPKTGDEIINFIIIGSISLFGLFGILLYKKN